jgi:predicted nucleic acid-binding protein
MTTTRPYLRFGTPTQDATPDAGESEAIAMSLEWPADLLIMDESSDRAMARNLKIRITGTLGVLLKATRYGQIPSLEFEMDRLVQDAGFFVSDRVRNAFLAEAGESP